ncbi:MAG: ATP-grasp domain-containing protein [Patescibacteria group bacterium]
MIKAIVVYFDDPSAMGYPFDEPNYYLSYQGFSELCQKHNIDFYIARGSESYLGHSQFRSGWQFGESGLIKINHSITADVIYVKGNTLVTEPGVQRVNQAGLMDICRNKLKTYALFGQYMPQTLPLPEKNWPDVIKKITTDKIVIKPVSGMEGRGIVVVDKTQFDYTQLDQSHAPFLVQEFIDCSAGIPGLVTGRHDLRLYIFNGVMKLAEYRQPKTGSYLANVAQGGSLTVLNLNQVPSWASEFVNIIDQHLTEYYPRIYTIDLMYAQNRPYLVELNSRPGLPYPGWSYYNDLHRYILETLTKN